MNLRKLIRHILLQCILPFLSVLPSVAQVGSYSYQNTVEVSPSNELHCIFIDSDGLLWIGTNSMLCSFDGYKTNTFRSDVFTPNIFPSNEILSIAEDKNRNLWIGTKNGIVRFHRKNGMFKTYSFDDSAKQRINTILITQSGDIFLGSEFGVARYDSRTDQFLYLDSDNNHIVLPDGKISSRHKLTVKSLAEDREGNIYVGTWSDGLFMIKKNDNRFFAFPQINNPNSAYSLFFDSKNRLWVGSWGAGAALLNEPQRIADPDIIYYRRKGVPLEIVYQITEDPLSNHIWLAQNDGICVVNPDDLENPISHFSSLDGKNSLETVKGVIADTNRNIWVGTMNNGVVRLANQRQQFDSWQLPEKNNAGKKIEGLRCVFTQDGENFLLGIYPTGIALFNCVEGSYQGSEDIPFLENFHYKDFKNAVHQIIQRENGEIWMAADSWSVISIVNGKTRPVHDIPSSVKVSNSAQALYEAKDCTMWVGARDHLSFCQLGDSLLTVIEATAGINVNGISEDNQGNIWLATDNNGIICLKKATKTKTEKDFTRYDISNGKFMANDAIQCLQDKNGQLWAITNSGGLFRYNKEKDLFEPLNIELHIQGTRALALTEDDNGTLWMLTDHAIYSIHKDENGDYIAVGHKNMRTENEKNFFLPNSMYNYNGNIYFGNCNQLVKIRKTDSLNTNQKVLGNLVITDLIVDDVPFLRLDPELATSISKVLPTYARKLNIAANIRKITLAFSLLNYSQDNMYAYKLDGYDDDWHLLELGLNQVTYENLPSGNYQFRLRARQNANEQWVELPYDLQLHVAAPWYASWWAYLLYIAALIAVIYWLFARYRRSIQVKNKLQMGEVVTNLTHELLTPLSVVSASVDELQMENEDEKGRFNVIHNNINRMTTMLRQILEVRKSQDGRLRLEVSHKDLNQFVDYTVLNLNWLAYNKQCKIVYASTEKPLMAWFDTDKLQKILYNLLSNAIKYTDKKGADIYVTLQPTDGNKAVIKVSDQGIGISPEKMRHLYERYLDGDYRMVDTYGTGLGLSLTHDLVKLHHGSIECRSEVGKGTEFTVTIPISETAYEEHEKAKEQPAIVDEQSDHDDIESVEAFVEREKEENDTTDYTILVVEDNNELRESMQRLLTGSYRTLTARNGRLAFNIIERESIDVVVSDVMMPVMDGYELTRMIKENDDYAQLPVILLTAKTSESDEREGYVVGADAYIRKPFRMAELKLRIDNIIANRERIRRKFMRNVDYKVEEEHLSNPDVNFIQQAIECVHANLDNSEYGREQLARDMLVSSSSLYNKLRAITGQKVTGFINSIRLKAACKIAKANPDIRVSELADRVGFNSVRYFTMCFKKEYGTTLKEWLQQETESESEPES